MAFCEHCGKEMADEAVVCPACKERVAGKEETPPVDSPQERLPEGIERGEDGVLRWSYAMSLWKNPTIFITSVKVFGGILAGIGLFLFFLTLWDGHGLGKAFTVFKDFLLWSSVVTVGMLLLAFGVLTLFIGASYDVAFEMDEKGVEHTQQPRQHKRTRKMGLLTAFVGLLTLQPAVAGSGLMAASRWSMYSKFSQVDKVRGKARRNVIHVRSGLMHNQIYVTKEQYGFVLDHIARHCRKGASIKG
ncbi:MAG: hypothetical protein ACOX9C_08370 [Kiritimatiellia bacterium]